jgi:anti-sigma regulatory factor (Ser/Thr protein kinase)
MDRMKVWRPDARHVLTGVSVPSTSVRRLALRLTLIYVGVSALWIILSDRALGWFGLTAAMQRDLASVKGMVYLAVTGTIIYVLAKRYLGGLSASEERYQRLFDNAAEGLTVFLLQRDEGGKVNDLMVADVNPVQAARSGRPHDEVVGLSSSDAGTMDVRTQAYFSLVERGVAAGETIRSELVIEADDAVELLTVYPIGADIWAVASMDITEVRRAEGALRQREEAVRQAYVDVLDAVTGGKFVLVTEDELEAELGRPLLDEQSVRSPAELREVRRTLAASVARRFPGWTGQRELLSPFCEALNNALKHGSDAAYQLFANGDVLQLAVTDAGPGIDFRTLPRATLVPGYSTIASLGMGFTIMLRLSDRMLLTTRPGRTVVVLEIATPDVEPEGMIAGTAFTEA